MDYSLLGSSVHGILQARILEWVVISFSRGTSQPRDRTRVSRIAGGSFIVWATREAQSGKEIVKVSLKALPSKLLLLLSHFSHVQHCVTLWTTAHQVSLSMGFSRQGYWSGLPCPPPGDLPSLGIKPGSPALQADSLPLSRQGSPMASKK